VIITGKKRISKKGAAMIVAAISHAVFVRSDMTI
jgi:hypothetical protein